MKTHLHLNTTPFIEIRKSTNLPDEATSRHQLAERPPEITGRTSSATMWNYRAEIAAEVETFKVTHRSASDRIWKSSKMCDPEIATDPRWFLQHRMVYTALMGFFKFGTSSDKCYQLNQGVRQWEKEKKSSLPHEEANHVHKSLSCLLKDWRQAAARFGKATDLRTMKNYWQIEQVLFNTTSALCLMIVKPLQASHFKKTPSCR